jgi:hypothetical protein
VSDEDAAAMKHRWEHTRVGVTLETGVVPLDAVYVVGDNAPNSEDSRAFGPVSLDTVVGRARLEANEKLTHFAEFRPGRPKRVPPSRHAVMAGV